MNEPIKIRLKDGRDATMVDTLGDDFIVDVGTSPDNWDTIMVSPYEIDELSRNNILSGNTVTA